MSGGYRGSGQRPVTSEEGRKRFTTEGTEDTEKSGSVGAVPGGIKVTRTAWKGN